MKFIDEVQIDVASGKGGPGCISFRREAFVPRGGPDGGDGGRGGHIIFTSQPKLHSLLDYRYQKTYKAENGAPGRGQKCTGRSGHDLVLEVPVGSLIKSADKVFDLSTPHKQITLLKGGRGGKGNHFYKSPTLQAPRKAQKGEPGQSQSIHLELKLLAHVALLGLPNAGKSTLLSRLSAARPRVADYPFTTLIPQLGVVRCDTRKSFVMADLPGLIEGAHKGRGLGYRFLKHLERAQCFLHLVDAYAPNPIQNYFAIQNELQLYDHTNTATRLGSPLCERPRLVALNKIDLLNRIKLQELKQKFQAHNIPVLDVSAATGKNLSQLKYKLEREVFQQPTQQLTA